MHVQGIYVLWKSPTTDSKLCLLWVKTSLAFSYEIVTDQVYYYLKLTHRVYVEIRNCYNLFQFSVLDLICNSKVDLHFHFFSLKEEGNHVSSSHQGLKQDCRKVKISVLVSVQGLCSRLGCERVALWHSLQSGQVKHFRLQQSVIARLNISGASGWGERAQQTLSRNNSVTCFYQ